MLMTFLSQKFTHPASQRLQAIVKEKKTRLCLAADVKTSKELIELAKHLGPQICVLKTHIDIIKDFTPQLTKELKKIAQEEGFLIFEDRKFADIGSTVYEQYSGGMYQIAEWADLINAHSLPGPGVIEGLKKAGLTKKAGLLLLAQMSSQNNLFTEIYTEKTYQLAQKHRNFIIGFISQKNFKKDPKFIHFTPGVQFELKIDSLKQAYRTPEIAIKEQNNDIIIVGRGILNAINPLEKAKKYKQHSWDLQHIH